MKISYPAIFYAEDDTHYSVIFPDFNYLATCGSTLQEANEMAIDCLKGALDEELPTPSKTVDPDKVAKELDFEYRSCFIKQIEL